MSTIAIALLWNSGLATALAVLVAFASRHRGFRRRPALLHALWLLVLAKLITPPLISLPVLPSFDRIPTEMRTPAAANIGEHPSMLLGASRAERERETLSVVAAIETATTSTPSAPWLATALGVSGCVTLFLVAGSFWQYARVSRILSRANSGDDRLHRLARIAAARMGMNLTPVVCVVDACIVPFLAVRWSGPTIVLPSALVARMTDEQITGIIGHELAHYVRRDHWSNVFALLVVACTWWHPIAWWARRELRSVQEVCCDALVLASGNATRRCYAETMFQVLEFIQATQLLRTAPLCGFGGRASLTRRFEMIASLTIPHRSSWWAKALIAICFALMFCVPARGQLPTGGAPGARSAGAQTGIPAQTTESIGRVEAGEDATVGVADEFQKAVGQPAAGVFVSGRISKDYHLIEKEADRLVALLEAFGHDRIYIWAYDRAKGTTSITGSEQDHQLIASLVQLLVKERRRPPRELEMRDGVVWRRLGLALDAIDAGQLRRVNPQLHGGLIVTAVRSSSPAEKIGLREGDVIIGLEKWESISVANVEWVLERSNREPLRVVLVRDNEIRSTNIGPDSD